ncbi:coil containing protein [Vibrio phage 120E34-1]|nr:coil containing protein [Vibrio phage 120E34-1]
MKMSDVFGLPLVVCKTNPQMTTAKPTRNGKPDYHRCTIRSPFELEVSHAVHAINNHDRMVEEIAELKAAIEAAVRIKELWLPMSAFSDSPPEHCAEIEALHKMANKFEKSLAKLNQEGGG